MSFNLGFQKSSLVLALLIVRLHLSATNAMAKAPVDGLKAPSNMSTVPSPPLDSKKKGGIGGDTIPAEIEDSGKIVAMMANAVLVISVLMITPAN